MLRHRIVTQEAGRARRADRLRDEGAMTRSAVPSGRGHEASPPEVPIGPSGSTRASIGCRSRDRDTRPVTLASPASGSPEARGGRVTVPRRFSSVGGISRATTTRRSYARPCGGRDRVRARPEQGRTRPGDRRVRDRHPVPRRALHGRHRVRARVRGHAGRQPRIPERRPPGRVGRSDRRRRLPDPAADRAGHRRPERRGAHPAGGDLATGAGGQRGPRAADLVAQRSDRLRHRRRQHRCAPVHAHRERLPRVAALHGPGRLPAPHAGTVDRGQRRRPDPLRARLGHAPRGRDGPHRPIGRGRRRLGLRAAQRVPL
jgi:hypothetical protein